VGTDRRARGDDRQIRPQDVAELVAQLVAKGKAPGTIRKTVQAVAMVLDHAGIEPNPARNRVVVKLPREEQEELNPPTAEHVAAVYRRLPERHRLALLFLDWSGARVASIDLTRVGDYDEPRRRLRLRASTTKTRRALWIELPPGPRGRDRGDASASTLPRSGGAAVRGQRSGRASDRDREGM
jgi:hypothetical protein